MGKMPSNMNSKEIANLSHDDYVRYILEEVEAEKPGLWRFLDSLQVGNKIQFKKFGKNVSDKIIDNIVKKLSR